MKFWQRYGLLIVITEAHLGDTANELTKRDWPGTQQAKADGRAVTVWALLNLYG